MPDKVTYEYSVIRIVPRVEREEFLNVGVIVFSKPKGYLGLKYYIDEDRLKAFSGEIEVDVIREHLRAWEQVAAGGAEGGSIGEQDMAYRFRWLTAPKSTIIQCSRPHPGLCQEPEQTLEQLFKLYVA